MVQRTGLDPLAVVKSYENSNPFIKYSMLSMQMNSLNLGQGFPDYSASDLVINAAEKALEEGLDCHLPSPSTGNPKFVNTFAKVASQRLQREIDPEKNIFTDIGCSGTYATAAHCLLEEGDECILFEPLFTWYPMLEFTGVKCKVSGFDWCEEEQRFKINIDHVRSLITPKTRMITLINPNNPDGKMLSLEELEGIRQICLENPRIFIFSDEVYNLFVFDGNQHIPTATLPDMYERTITFYSAGKEFSSTGWRVGIAVGPEVLIEKLVEFKRWAGEGSATNNQLAMHHAYTQAQEEYKGEESFFAWKKKDYQARKDAIFDVLEKGEKARIDTIPAEGGYTFNTSIRDDIQRVPVKYFYSEIELPEGFDQANKASLNEEGGLTEFGEWMNLPAVDHSPDQAYVQWLTREIGITAIPGSYLFYNKDPRIENRKGVDVVRFSLCKKFSVFEDMSKALSKDLHE